MTPPGCYFAGARVALALVALDYRAHPQTATEAYLKPFETSIFAKTPHHRCFARF